jgi:hypothetical protein
MIRSIRRNRPALALGLAAGLAVAGIAVATQSAHADSIGETRVVPLAEARDMEAHVPTWFTLG